MVRVMTHVLFAYEGKELKKGGVSGEKGESEGQLSDSKKGGEWVTVTKSYAFERAK